MASCSQTEAKSLSAADALRQLQAEIAALKDHSGDLRVKNKKAQDDVTLFGKRHIGLQAEREANGKRRQDASEEVGRITKRQLSEIKQLTRAPPDSIKRTLIAAWILLHCERFKGKLTVQFDEVKDWSRCQRMLTDDNFINNIINYNTTALCEAPHVIKHIASHYFGFGSTPATSSADPGNNNVESAPMIGKATTAPLLPALGRSSTRASLAGPLRRSKTVDVKPPLDVEMVSHASSPCGALLCWMLELVREHVEEERLRKDLDAVEALLREAEARLDRLEADMAEAEAKLAMKKTQAEEKERELQKARAEVAKQPAPAPAPLAFLPAKKKAAPPPPPTPKIIAVEVEMGGSMAHVERDLASCRVPFEKDAIKVLCGNVEQALLLPKLADIIKASKGSLKVLLEGHRSDKEKDGDDVDRTLAVYEWLVQAAAVRPGNLRIRGFGDSQGQGSCVIPVPIHELAVKSGPIPQEISSVSSKAGPGLYFQASSATLTSETRTIASAMGEFLNAEDDVAVRLEGHTHGDESDDLGWDRAVAIREVLVGLGIKASRLKPMNAKHLHPLSTLHGALNRRVELHEI